MSRIVLAIKANKPQISSFFNKRKQDIPGFKISFDELF
jgi:hypothetical protein